MYGGRRRFIPYLCLFTEQRRNWVGSSCITFCGRRTAPPLPRQVRSASVLEVERQKAVPRGKSVTPKRVPHDCSFPGVETAARRRVQMRTWTPGEGLRPPAQQTLKTEGAWARYFSWKALRMGTRLAKAGRKEASDSQQFFIRR